MSNRERLIIVVLGSWDTHIKVGWYQLHSNKFGSCIDRDTCLHDILFISCNNGLTVSENKSNSYDMVFIREDFYKECPEEFKSNIKQIIKSNLYKQVAIAVHHTSGRIENVELAVAGFENVHPPKAFSRTEEENKIWEKLKPLIESIANGNCKEYREEFVAFWDHCVKTDEKKKVNEILHLFLPLDIDMQALSDTKVDKEKYLKQMQEESPDYLRSLPDKLKEIQEKIGTLDIKGADGERLKELIGLDKKNSEKSPIYKFLESLGTAMKYDVIKFDCLNTLFSENKKENDINQFNKWYRELAGELKKLMPISETERY